MKTVIAFAAGVIIASGIVYFFLNGRAAQPAATQVVQAQAPQTEPEKPDPAPIVVEEPAPEPAVEQKLAMMPMARKPIADRRRQAAAIAPRAAVEIAAYVPPPEPVQPPPQAVAIPAAQPAAPAAPAEPEWKPMPPVERRPNTVTLAANTTLVVRLAEAVSSEKQQTGDNFSATLDQPLVVDGLVVAERGSRIDGRVVSAERAGRIRGTAHLELELVNLSTADGQNLKIRTNTYRREGETWRREDAEKVGIGAAIGAAIGAMAGGGKGAAIGAGAGGAAGAGTVAAMRGKAAALPIETQVTFRLSLPITVTERLP